MSRFQALSLHHHRDFLEGERRFWLPFDDCRYRAKVDTQNIHSIGVDSLPGFQTVCDEAVSCVG